MGNKSDPDSQKKIGTRFYKKRTPTIKTQGHYNMDCYLEMLEAQHYAIHQPEEEIDETNYTDCGEIELGEEMPDYM
jgi:hypothetical protein